jgi:hypothetical protein
MWYRWKFIVPLLTYDENEHWTEQQICQEVQFSTHQMLWEPCWLRRGDRWRKWWRVVNSKHSFWATNY